MTTKKRLGDLLIDAGLVNPLQLRAALAEQKRWGKPLGRTLVEMEIVNETELTKVLSQHLGVAAVELDRALLNEKAARRLAEDFCRDNELIPFAHHEQGRFLDVAMADPTDSVVLDQIRVHTECNVRPFLAGPLAIEQALNRIHVGTRPGVQGRSKPLVVSETLFEFGDRPSAPADSQDLGLSPIESLEVPIEIDTPTVPQPGLAPRAGQDNRPPAILAPEPLDASDHGDAQGVPDAARAPGAVQLPPLVAPAPSAANVPEEVATDLARLRAEISDLRQQARRNVDLASALDRLRAGLAEVQALTRRTESQLRNLVGHLVAQGIIAAPRRKEAEAVAGQPAPAQQARRSPPATPPAHVAAERPSLEETPAPPAAQPQGTMPPPSSDEFSSPPRLRADVPSGPRHSNDLPAVSGTIDVPNVPTGAVVAMDFGTSRSSVATVVNGKIVSIKLRGGWDMPSVVGFADDGTVVLGHAAREMLATDPRNAVPWPKRLVGRRFRDRELEPYLATMAIPYSEGPHGEIVLHAQDATHSVSEVCSHLLRRLRLAAEHTISRPVTEVVLTTPVSYDKPQIDGLREAASLAGLKVVDFVDEPVAAAFTNRSHPSFRGLVAVYDFGGGTFDFSVVEVSGSDVSVVTSAGDAWLGGDDFDEALANAAANAFWRKTNIELRNQVVEFQRLLIAAEQAKQRLSVEPQTVLKLPRAALVSQGALDLEFTISQAEFARLSQDIIQRSLDTCEQALSLNGIKVSDLNAVYLSGGTSYIPAVREALARFFGRPPHVTVPPERAVILGAALHAAVIER